MNPKSFPKRLDSKTSCLRITVPENLDLALEGLIRKVLREQPKTDDIYAFAANYFETLLRIRDKAGVEYKATQLCPFHNDEEAREMIVLAGTFSKQVPDRVQGKGPAPLKAEAEKKTGKVEPEKVDKISKETLKESKSDVETKQATPDLIKKLPLLAQDHGLNVEEPSDSGPNREGTETVKEGGDEEEYQTSDPIKEFVEKELLTERNSKEKVAEGSSGPTTEEVKNEGGAPLVSNADEKKGSGGGDDLGAKDDVTGVIHAGEDEGKQKMEPETRETNEKGVEAVDAEGKIVCAAQPEAEGERPLEEMQQKKEKENEESTSKPRAEEESDNKMELAPETEAEAEGIEAPLPPLPSSPGGAEKHAQEVVHEVPHSNTEADLSPELEGSKPTQTQMETSSEAASPKEEGIVEVGKVQKSPEGKNEIDVQPSTPSPTKIDEESPKTSSLVTSDSKPVENDGDLAAETDNSQKSCRKEANNSATESVACSEGEAQEPITEVASGPTEQRTNGSETGSSSEGAKGVQEVKEDRASFEEEDLQRKKGGESNEERKNLDTRAEEPGEPDLKSTEEVTSAGAVEAVQAAEKPEMRAENSMAETLKESIEFSDEPDTKADGSEILKPEEFSNSHVMSSDKESEPKSEDQEGKEGGDKKLSDEEEKTKDQSLAEGRESPGKRTSPEEFPLEMAEDVQCASEAPPEETTDAKQSSPMSPTGLTEPGETAEITGRETESAESQEFKTEDGLMTENETVSSATEELCSVVDINHLKRDEGNQEEPEPAKPRPGTPEEKSAPEPESSPSASISPSAPNGETWSGNRNDKPNSQRESEAEDAIHGKNESEEPPNATPVQVPTKSETDREQVDFSERTPPENQEAFREGFDPSATGKQIIIVEEPEMTSENPEESSSPGEIQIKTIQTHYYDALRVPETVTREYRMHEVIAPTIVGLVGASTPPPSTPNETRESPGDEQLSGRLTDDHGIPPTPKTSPTSDGLTPSPYGEDGEAQPGVVEAGSLLALDGSDRDAQASVSEDFPRPATPTSDVSSDLFELSSRAASETFLTNEKHFSSLEKEEIRFVTPATEEVEKDEKGRVVDSDEGAEDRKTFTAEDRPASRESGKTEVAEESTEKEDVTEQGERPSGSASGGPPRAADGDFPIDSASEKTVSESRPGGEDRRSTELTPTGEASHAETDSAPTEVKRPDSARREFVSARSLDLGKRNPLLRTRSLSAHRHGVADFEVWSTIEKELEEAATKIQSKFRGYKTRKKLRREVAVQISTEDSSERSTPEEANDPDDHPRATGEFHDGIALAEHPR